MSRRSLRYGGIALAGTMAVGILANQSAIATNNAIEPMQESVIAQALASLSAAGAASAPTGTTSAPAAVTTAVVVPALTKLSVPNLGAAVTPQGYALRDMLLDLSPDLADRDLAFTVQRQNGATWVDAATGTTSGPNDVATVAAMPAGTYRVVVPAQFGMEQFVGAPFQHQPRQLAASLSYSADSSVTTADVNPDPAAGGAYQFVLQRKASGGWTDVSSHTTSTADGQFGFSNIPSGTYRIVVPDQADALGAASNEVAVVSAADKRAAAARAAAERAAASAAAGRSATSQPSSAGRAPVADAPSSGNTGGIVGVGLAQVGDTYRLGGNGPSVFDCSGLTSYAYRQNGISIPRTASAQYRAATKVSNPRPGDLVFFLNGAQHVGIYIGNGKMVHAANPRRGVEVSSINSGWYASTFTGFGRF